MTRVELSKLARRQLNTIARLREQPEATFASAAAGVTQLSRHPESGQAVGGAYHGWRSLSVGKQPILLVHRYDAERGVVSIAAVFDGRDRNAPQP